MSLAPTIQIPDSNGYRRFVGPGDLILASPLLGDIVGIYVGDAQEWFVCRDALMASTESILIEFKDQKIKKSNYEILEISRLLGNGIFWVTSYGTLIRRDLTEDETYIINGEHLIAWSCAHVVERIKTLSWNTENDKGLIFKFTGPGTLFLQTGNRGFSILGMLPVLKNLLLRTQ
jgi:uncharacterized protein (AIM24 family)